MPQIGGSAGLSIQLIDSSHIQAVTDAQPAGSVSVSVQDSDGQIAVKTAAFTFANPAPLLRHSGSG